MHKVKVRVPTNIALLKYWGKDDERTQWPANDSLSMTLDLYTETSAQIIKEGPSRVTFNGEVKRKFYDKPLKFIDFLAKQLGYVDNLEIRSHNQFPSSCGIASSASGLGALTLAAIACWTQSASMTELNERGFSLQRIAGLARMGSGSACRSFSGGFVHWQKGKSFDTQSVAQIKSRDNWKLRDCIVILSDVEKKVSSTLGHRAAWNSPLFTQRLKYIPNRLKAMKSAIANSDLSLLGPLIEEDAFEMHEVVSTSGKGFAYLTKDSRDFMDWFKKIREQHKIKAYMTVDAGPNIHIIYEEQDRPLLLEVINQYKYIDVGISSGPEIISVL